MNEHLQTTTGALGQRYGAELSEFRGQYTLTVPAGRIVDVCRDLRDEFGFEMLAGSTAVDYWPEQEPRFHVVYMLHSLKHNVRLSLRAPLDGNFPTIETVEGIYPSANWYEREIFDMFGIRFENHSDMRRIVMPYDWEGHPLRKDYPLGYEEVQFSFNYDEIDARKPYAKE